MENVMGMVFMLPRGPGVHLHRVSQPYAYCHLLQQQQDFMLQEQEDLMLLQQEFMLYEQQQKKIKYTKRMPMKFIWTFPGSTMLKLNTDGSSKGNPGPSSFGGLIRDSDGRWLCGYMGKMKGRSYTSLEAEIWSIFKGLCLVKEKNLSNLFIETDCQAAIMLGVGGVDKDHPMKAVMDAINTIMMAQKCVLVHTRRDGNHSADQLAKLAANQSEEYKVLEEPPAKLIPYLLRDNEAAMEFERNSQNY